jgi:hypothetical protein
VQTHTDTKPALSYIHILPWVLSTDDERDKLFGCAACSPHILATNLIAEMPVLGGIARNWERQIGQYRTWPQERAQGGRARRYMVEGNDRSSYRCSTVGMPCDENHGGTLLQAVQFRCNSLPREVHQKGFLDDRSDPRDTLVCLECVKKRAWVMCFRPSTYKLLLLRFEGEARMPPKLGPWLRGNRKKQLKAVALCARKWSV